MTVQLRPEQPSDIPLLTGEVDPFNDFGPQRQRSEVAPPGLDDAGGLIVTDEDDTVAGFVSWHWERWGPNVASRCPMIGIWLTPRARGRGIGAAAQRMLADLFFANTTVNRVEAHTDVENIAEQRALERAGFTREGLTRGAQWRAGAYHDGYLYSIIRGDIEAPS